MASMYAVYHGPAGLRAIALGVHAHAEALRDALREGGVDVADGPVFDTLRVRVPGRAGEVVDTALAARGQPVARRRRHRAAQRRRDDRPGRPGPGRQGVRRGRARAGARRDARSGRDALVRTSDYLTHPVFSAHHSETAMLRYLRRLADRDFALDRGMIPLGSCTMKLNATTEMVAVTWPEFAQVHPFAPHEQTRGIRGLVDELSGWLCEITGYDAVSLQPNAGSQGELAGLLAIAAYHRSRGDDQRTVCLIPSSAHGTNAASAVMAGLRVVVVRTDPITGNVDLDDLKTKVEEHRDDARGDHGDLPLDARRLRGHHHRPVRAWCTTPAARSTSTAPTSTPSSASPGPASSEPTSRTSTCTRPSASRTAAAARGSGRSGCVRTSRRTCPTTRSTSWPGPPAGSARSRPRPTAPRASCRSPGRTCG